MTKILFCLRFLLLFSIAGCAGAVLVASGAALFLLPQLPSINELTEIQLHTPLRVFSQDRKLIAEFGEKRRTPLTYRQIPKDMINAVLAAEDDRFFEHAGVDLPGLTRAFLELAQSGRIQSGGSTITMQVAKNFFLSHDRKFIRKFKEILLALQIEQNLSKEAILELYLNKIFLGNRAYGLAAAAEVYYGKTVDQLSLAEIAMIAGLPKAPSRFNPIVNPERAKKRRNWILGRMLALGYIDEAEYKSAKNKGITAAYHGLKTEVEAPYFAELVRQQMVDQFGNDAYNRGFNVYTTLNSELQKHANQAMIEGLMKYSKRHGYLGPEQNLSSIESLDEWYSYLDHPEKVGPLEAGLVTRIEADSALVRLTDDQQVVLTLSSIEWAKPYITENRVGKTPQAMSDILAIGDVIRVQRTPIETVTNEQVNSTPEFQWTLAQLPKIQGALTALSSVDGAIVSMVGGFNFNLSKFNRATQARRQAGSCFKPFVYGAALANGYTPASIINDAPIVYDDISQGEAWRPRNAGDKFKGPIRLRQALYESRNLVSIRLLRELGVGKVIDFASAAGLDKARIEPNLSIALGTAQFTTTEMAQAYATIANGGYKIIPYFVNEITDQSGTLIFKADPSQACGNDCEVGAVQAPQVIDSRDQFLLDSMLKDVIQKGTGQLAKTLNRTDIAGKTGTTNEQRDAWFSGYHPYLSVSVWVGFDQPSSLGRQEYGGKAALPIWIDYMKEALKNLPETHFSVPEGITSVKIDPATGLRAMPNQQNGIFEYFKVEDNPEEWDQNAPTPPAHMSNESETIENIF